MPVTVVPTSFATVAIETFITELSSVIRNCPAASVSSTSVAPPARADGAASAAGPPAGPVPLEAATCAAYAAVTSDRDSLRRELPPPVPLTAVGDPPEREQ